MGSVPLHAIDKVRYQIVASLQLDINITPSFITTDVKFDQTVVYNDQADG
jgi:hypothetical protein